MRGNDRGFEVVGTSDSYMSRRYIEESDVGNLFADRIRAAADTDFSFIHAGSLRKDIPSGALTHADLLDVYPFMDDVMRFEITGAQLREVASGTRTLKDAMNEALRDWISHVSSTFYVIGTVAGPHPYPMLVRDFQSVIGREAKRPLRTK